MIGKRPCDLFAPASKMAIADGGLRRTGHEQIVPY